MVDLIHEGVTEQVLAAAFEVSNHLGAGFLEKVYENALKFELKLRGLSVESQKQVVINYKGKEVGLYQTDLIVEGKIIVEVKSIDKIVEVHKSQVINYLMATGLEVGLILNFGNPKVQYKRIVLQQKARHYQRSSALPAVDLNS